ncbi:MAG: hypothetical protein M3Z54_11190 [Gemmatimonadota bacterium]|nr:hypothetical protein [Gemmatimonadota bacterium]
MSSKPLLLSDNWFESVLLNPSYAIAVDQPLVSGRELFRVADNLRDLTSCTTPTLNTRVNFYVVLPTAKAPTILILDRGHNLAGKNCALAGYADPGFVTQNYTYTFTVPSTPGGLGTDANGCLTSDGVWWRSFSGLPASAVWSVAPAPLGVGIAPILTGVYLGTSYRFPEYLNAPAAYDYGTTIKHMRNELSRGGVRSKSRPLNFDKLAFNVHLDSADYSGFDTEVRRLLRYGQPWWFCLDDSDATGSGLMRLFQSSADMDYNPQVNPVHREIQFQLEEVIPTLFV